MIVGGSYGFLKTTAADETTTTVQAPTAVGQPQPEDIRAQLAQIDLRNANLLRLADFIRKLNERDMYGFQLLKEELRLAYELEHLPSKRRQKFFDTQILPLRQAQDNVVEEEIQMANKAIEDGMPLPKDIVEALKARAGKRESQITKSRRDGTIFGRGRQSPERKE